MKTYISLISVLVIGGLNLTSCDKKAALNLNCNEFTLNEQFTAKINEEWCLDGTALRLRFGPFMEDSRCNVVDVQCVWAGRYVMGVIIDNGEAVQDTFVAETNWQDTLYQGGYRIILAKVHPEIRTTTDQLDPSAYSFDVIVK